MTRPLTVPLQESARDAGAAREKVSHSYVHLEKMRDEFDVRHELWYQEAFAIAKSVQTTPQRPRIAGRQFHRANTPAESPLEYYKQVVTIPFLDHLRSQIQTRFSKTNLDVMNAVYRLPKNVMTSPN